RADGGPNGPGRNLAAQVLIRRKHPWRDAMLPQPPHNPQSSTLPADAGIAPTSVRIGVGIDTSRYGHYAVFLRDDLQTAAAHLAFAESGSGYAQLRARLAQIAQRHPAVAFHIRLDGAGQYADNLLHFLQELAWHSPEVPSGRAFTISCGDPQRNKNYRA